MLWEYHKWSMRQTKSILTNYLTKEKSSVEDSGLFNPGHAWILSSALSWNEFVSFQENIRSCLSQWMAFLKCSVIYRENRTKKRCCYWVLQWISEQLSLGENVECTVKSFSNKIGKHYNSRIGFPLHTRHLIWLWGICYRKLENQLICLM